MRISVLGAGAWGLTLADLLASKGNELRVWDCDAEAMEMLRTRHTRGRPKGLVLPHSVVFCDDFEEATVGAGLIVCVVPSFAVRDVCRRVAAREGGLGNAVFVNCSKGIEEDTLLLPSQVFEEFLGRESSDRFVALSGPSHAEEVWRRMPTVVVSSSSSPETAGHVRDIFMLPSFRIYTQTDCLGVELGGALKNVIAIAAGMCDGMGFGDNTKAALITRGLAEIARAACVLGALPETLSGLAGLGDLIVTAMSRHSRNRGFGELIARGKSVKEALVEVREVVEGYRTSHSVFQLARKLNVEMPMSAAVYRVLYEGMSVAEAVESLLARQPRPEVYQDLPKVRLPLSSRCENGSYEG